MGASAGNIGQDKSRIIFWVAGIAILALIIFGITRCIGVGRKDVAREFEKEPVITLYIAETGEKREMPIEEYLQGVVAGEMEKGWPIEAYAAQAILARSFTMEFLSRGGTRAKHGTDISTDEEEAQAYNPAAITDDIRQAVEMTRGEVMTYKGRYARGWFHAASGGKTTLAKYGLAYKGEEPPYTKIVDVPVEVKYAPNEALEWAEVFTLDEIAAALSARGVSVSGLQNVEIAGKDETGRAILFKLTHSQGQTEIAGADLRVALDPQRMRSIWLTDLSVKDGKVFMAGKGFGHGVGLSQWGAYGLAKEGMKPEDIVLYFFEGIEIKKLWK